MDAERKRWLLHCEFMMRNIETLFELRVTARLERRCKLCDLDISINDLERHRDRHIIELKSAKRSKVKPNVDPVIELVTAAIEVVE